MQTQVGLSILFDMITLILLLLYENVFLLLMQTFPINNKKFLLLVGKEKGIH